MKSDFLLAFNQICSDRGLSREIVLEALEMALVSAYRRNADISATQNITASIDLETGKPQVFVEKLVVEKATDPDQEISLNAARRISPNIQVGDAIMVDSTPKDFGRIAAQSAKQIILQRIREAERDAQYTRYVQQEGEIVHGTVHSVTSQAVILHIDGTEATLPRNQQVPGERYNLHQRLRAYVLEVRKTSRGPQITVSRSHKNMLRRLLELEVPEIFNGTVEIKAITREAGSRSKVAVAARQAGVDPVGACVGMRGVRIQSIVNELGGEKIDVIEWDADPATFIAKALSPAKVLGTRLDDDPIEGRTASVVVPDDQLSLAIGRAGQNARLAAKLTGWRIDIQSVTEAATESLRMVNEDPEVLPALGTAAELLPQVAGILRRHEQDRLSYNAEELLVLRQVIDAVQGYFASIRSAERERARADEMARRAAIAAAENERRAAIAAAHAQIPDEAYSISLTDLDLSSRVLNHLTNAEIQNVGDILERLAEGDEGLLKLDGFGPRSLAEVQECIDALALVTETEETEDVPTVQEVAVEAEAPIEAEPEVDGESLDETSTAIPTITLVEEEAEPEAATPVVEAPTTAESEITEPEQELPAPIEPEELTTAVEEVSAQEPDETAAHDEPAVPLAEPEGLDLELAVDEDDDLLNLREPSSSKKRQRRRELVFDENTGQLVARRQRKGSRRSHEWDDFID
ncbi:MAG: transcription termination/antitermination protein NusA [Chloroflexi bacterium]|nr:transcription termination/antitermination protein NusA [Chloroflexota bacterium]